MKDFRCSVSSVGVIGHADTFCEKRFDNYPKGMEMPYGIWLRATTRNSSSLSGNKWLWQSADGSSSSDGDGRSVNGGYNQDGKIKEGSQWVSDEVQCGQEIQVDHFCVDEYGNSNSKLVGGGANPRLR